MRELKKYWQATAAALANVRVGDQPAGASGLRVDIAGCRVMAPPVRQQQGASYIPRTCTAGFEGGNRYAATSPKTAPEFSGIMENAVENETAGKSAVPHEVSAQRAAFREFFVATVPLADDVLFIPVAPATASASDAVADFVERHPLARFV
jgi:hypothetical protein